MKEKYSKVMRLLHWFSAVVIFALIISGMIMIDEKPSDFKWFLYKNHKSFGVIIFSLFFIRIFVRIFSKLPPMPKELSNFWQVLAKIGHYFLYLLMFAVPLTGIAMTKFGGYDLTFFGKTLDLIHIDKNTKYAKLFNTLHENFAWSFAILIVGHVFASLKHFLMDKINLFKRII